MKKIIVFMLVLALSISIVPISAIAVMSEIRGTENGYYYVVSNGKATITGVDSIGGKVILPDKLGGYPVTSISDIWAGIILQA